MHSGMTTVIGSHFHEKIIKRYQKGNINVFRSPLLIFLKNKRRISSLKINIDILVKVFNKINEISTENIINVLSEKSLFSLIKIEHPIQQFIFQQYPLHNHFTDKISLFQYHEKERFLNMGHIWSANMPKVQIKVNTRTQYIHPSHPEAVHRVLMQGAGRPIFQYPRPEQGSQNIQRFPYNTGPSVTKTSTIPDTSDVPSSILRNIHQMVNTRKQYIHPMYPEAVYRVLIQGAGRPIFQYPRPEQGSQNIQRFPYNTGPSVTKTSTIPDTSDVPSSILRNIHQMVNTRTQYIHSPDSTVLHGAGRPASQHLRPGQNVQTVQHVPFRTQHRVPMMNSVRKTGEGLSPFAGNGLVNTRTQYIHSPDSSVLHGADRSASLHLRPSQNVQTVRHVPYPAQHRVPMMNSVHKTENVPSSLAGNGLVNTGTQYIHSPDCRVLHDADRPDSSHLRPGQNVKAVQHVPYPAQHRVPMMNSIHKTGEGFSSLAGNGLVNTTTQRIHSPDSTVLHGAGRPASQHLRRGQNVQTVQHVPYPAQHRVTVMNSVHRTGPSSLTGNGLVNARTQRIHPFSPEARVLKQGIKQTFEDHHHSEPAGFLPFTDRPAVSTEGRLLYFNDQQNIERKIEEVKKIAIDTREAVQERSASLHASGNTDFKKHLDVHRLSDQVYQNIEQRIRMEKERRGL
jgi:predicted component of type VI protein secretion system